MPPRTVAALDGPEMKRDQPKKTETLEIRVAAETKAALKAKAQRQGKSVSEVLRVMIAAYLRAPDASANRRRTIMRISSLAAGAAALIGVCVVLVPSAGARDLTLGVSAQLDSRSADASSHSVVATQLDLDFGQRVLLCVPRRGASDWHSAPNAATCTFPEGGGYAIAVAAHRVDDGTVLIGSRVLGDGETLQTVSLADASAMSIALGSEAAFQTGTPSESMRLTFSPSRP